MGPQKILELIRVWLDQAIQDCIDGATRTSDVCKKITQALSPLLFNASPSGILMYIGRGLLTVA